MDGIQSPGDAAAGLPPGAGGIATLALEGLAGLVLMLLVILDFVHH
jgi:hypothetical protein